eukprot:m.153037 g.153037  ORF g.153037 m.153037 type:complete len:191 (+) comp17903_c0_seq11:217-789(+)
MVAGRISARRHAERRTALQELSFVLGVVAVLFCIVATALPRMIMIDVVGDERSYGTYRFKSSTEANMQISCTDSYNGEAEQACNACKAFSVIAILLGAFGLAASIHIHEVFASFTKARSAACIAGASLSCLLTIAIWEGGIMKSGTGVDQGSRRESYALFVLGCLLYMASTVALARSTTVTVGPAGSTTV